MWWRLGVFAVILACAGGRASASTFTLETSAFLNGGGMPSTDAAAANHCGGRNLSPPLRLSGYPGGTRSFAIVVVDTDGGAGRGFVHWVAYGLARGTTVLPPGLGSQASPAFVGGTNSPGTTLYFGPCPPPGDPPHHYVFTAYALDLGPAVLPPRLSRADLLKAIAAHTLAQASITGTYAR
jgi:Raf kinase inhibitor-like YbhB/YbcL family protein